MCSKFYLLEAKVRKEKKLDAKHPAAVSEPRQMLGSGPPRLDATYTLSLPDFLINILRLLCSELPENLKETPQKRAVRNVF